MPLAPHAVLLFALALAAGPDPARAGAEPCPRAAAEVTLELDVDRGGAVTDARLVRPSGDPHVDRSILSSALSWKTHPATRDGLPVASRPRTRVRVEADPKAMCQSRVLERSWTPRVARGRVPRWEGRLAPVANATAPVVARWYRFGRQGPSLVLEQTQAPSPGELVAAFPVDRTLQPGIHALELRQGRDVLWFRTFEVARR